MGTLSHLSVFICKVGLLQGFNEIQPGIGHPIPWTIPVPYAPREEGCDRKESCPQSPARAGGPKERWEGHLEEGGLPWVVPAEAKQSRRPQAEASEKQTLQPLDGPTHHPLLPV